LLRDSDDSKGLVSGEFLDLAYLGYLTGVYIDSFSLFAI